MARMVWLNWSGGGNLPPSLGIARALTERGHEVAFVGRPEMVDRVAEAGFRPIEVRDAYAQADRYPDVPLRKAACYLTSPAVVDELFAIIARERPDALLVDAMFGAGLFAAKDFAGPKAVFSHSFLFRLMDRWKHTSAMFSGFRERAGFAPLPPLDEMWHAFDRMIVTTAAALDEPREECAAVRHAGPVLEDERRAIPVELPWADDAQPLVLTSFSTAPEQRALDKMQRALDALAPLAVRHVLTTARLASPGDLRVPPNAAVFEYAAHDPILRRASLVITHGGHGTAMRALRHGVPMIVLPGMAHDQAPIGEMLTAWGAGIGLAGDAGADAIRAAAQRILGDASYAARAADIAAVLAPLDGARAAADEVEAMLAARSAPAPV